MTSPDPREQFLQALRRELRCKPLAARRVVRELAGHLDDLVAELRAAGASEAAAAQEAVRRLGDPEGIAKAFSNVRPDRRRWSKALRSPAWVAAAAMSLVTALAAELPQASGAKATTRPAWVLPVHRLQRPTVARRAGQTRHRSPRSISVRARGAVRSP